MNIFPINKEREKRGSSLEDEKKNCFANNLTSRKKLLNILYR